jgi:hypothetical protein
VVTRSLHAALAQDVDSTSPLVKGIAALTLRDEAFFNMTWVNPKIHVLATTMIDATPSAGTGRYAPGGRTGGLHATTGSSASVM